ncbi:TKL protein kinase [Saprolegnia parasitica CBS 223.65]|uniref:TKL protein kinase n=1 Tax=Saprolegnia parasitica (strain CBS 223.65) TaxID=695850 RepID=A0A067BYN1_SAPPC|nr:TKL protein kinase [Saprolegnia parasitica CBS 223.65]KDO21960.1 TKL protein kinase [Saprolegnia parasitica CBS 223.65]|eukprot:XP_012207302.1 TKL protein kinase [Saprolegnia parasitica CBS 223.65]
MASPSHRGFRATTTVPSSSSAMADVCPYTGIPATLTAVRAYCSAPSAACSVDATCTRSGASFAVTAATPAFRNVSNVGDMTEWPTDVPLQFDTCPGLRIDQIKLPTALEDIRFLQCDWTTVPAALVYPPSLRQVHLSRNPLTAVPEGLPSALDALYLDGCLITTLEQLPPRIGCLYVANTHELILTHSMHRHLESNRVSALTSVDFDVENLYFGELPAASTVLNDRPGNPIDTIYNVTFSARLRLFDCPHCAITTFVVNEATYAVLQAATLSFKSVTFNATACNAVLGRPAVLHTWSICVLPTPDATTDGPSTAVLVQIVAGCLVLVMAAILLLVWRRRRQHRHSSTVVFEVYDDGDVTPVTSMYEPRETLDSCSLIVPELDTIKHLRLEASDILLLAPMSQGSYGEVWLAQYQNETIAIKKPMPSFLSATNMRRMIGEISLLSRLSSPYVVTLLGACWNRPMDLMMAMEHMDGGNLQGHLARHSQISLPWSFKLQSLVQIAEALAYLHAIPVVHRDLKCKNVLLDEKKGTKLGGFSISRETSATMTLGAGGHRWMAPEVLHAADYSTAVDVFSFGMVLTECDSHRAPYDREMDPDTGKLLAEVAIARRVSMGELTPTFTSTCPAWLEALATRCIDLTPQNRPTAADLVCELRVLLAAERCEHDGDDDVRKDSRDSLT